MVSNVKITMLSGAIVNMTVSKINVQYNRRGRVISLNYVAVPGSLVPMHLVYTDIESIWVDASKATNITRTP